MLLSDAIKKRGTGRKQASSQVKAPAPVPTAAPVKSVPTVEEVTGFLRGMNTRTGGEMYDAEFVEHPYQSYWVASPQDTMRADSVGAHGGSGAWRSDQSEDAYEEYRWDVWYRIYKAPLRMEVQAKLDDRFGEGFFDVSVEEKGNVYVTMRR